MHICMQNMQNGINLLKVLIFRVWRFQNRLWDAPETGQVPTSHQDSLDRASLNPRDHYPLRLKTDRLTWKSSGPGSKNDSPVPLLPGQVPSSIISWSCGNFSPPLKSGRAPLAGCSGVGISLGNISCHTFTSSPPRHSTAPPQVWTLPTPEKSGPVPVLTQNFASRLSTQEFLANQFLLRPCGINHFGSGSLKIWIYVVIWTNP